MLVLNWGENASNKKYIYYFSICPYKTGFNVNKHIHKLFSLSENKTKLISASISIKQCLKKDSFEPAPLGPHTVNFWGRRNFLRTSIHSKSVGGEESASEYGSIRKHQLKHPRESGIIDAKPSKRCL